MDTLGNCIDKLFTVHLKMSHNTERIKIENLNTQRIALENEIETILNKINNGELSLNDIVRPQHKTY